MATRLVWILGLALAVAMPGDASAQHRYASPDSVRLIASDIPNFWRALDNAAGKDSAERVRSLEEIYLRPGTPGLRDWITSRLANPDDVARGVTEIHSAAEQLLKAVTAYPRYYAGVRAPTLAVDTSAKVTAAIRQGLRRLTAMYPEARYGDVYFLIGTLSTGGTTGPSGMLIGTEQVVSGPDTPRDELPAWAQVATAAYGLPELPGLVLHETVHVVQPRYERKETLLTVALTEGVPDFISELAVGPWLANSPRQRYGRSHERAVWLDFKNEMNSDSTIQTWMYNGMVAPPKNHGATDIGYWVGYAIARKYYERAADKHAALRDLIVLADPQRILRESGYAQYAESLGQALSSP